MDDAVLPPACTWREARVRGARRGQVRADGVRPSRGLYLSSAVEPTLHERCRALTRVLPAEAAFRLAMAGLLWGAPVACPPRIQVVVPPCGVGAQRRDVAAHIRSLEPDDVTVLRGLRMTAPPQTFLDLAGALPAPELVAVGDALLRSGRMTRGRVSSSATAPGRGVGR